MRLLVASLLFLSSLTYGETHLNDDRRIKRREGPASQSLGLNGKLQWKGEYLQLKTPSGAIYELKSEDAYVTETLLRLVERRGNQIEISGDLEEKDGVKSLLVKTVERNTMDHNGYYVIVTGDDIDASDRDNLAEFLSNLPKTTIKREGVNIIIKTDFSEAHFEDLLRKASLYRLVEDNGPKE